MLTRRAVAALSCGALLGLTGCAQADGGELDLGTPGTGSREAGSARPSVSVQPGEKPSPPTSPSAPPSAPALQTPEEAVVAAFRNYYPAFEEAVATEDPELRAERLAAIMTPERAAEAEVFAEVLARGEVERRGAAQARDPQVIFLEDGLAAAEDCVDFSGSQFREGDEPLQKGRARSGQLLNFELRDGSWLLSESQDLEGFC